MISFLTVIRHSVDGVKTQKNLQASPLHYHIHISEHTPVLFQQEKNYRISSRPCNIQNMHYERALIKSEQKLM